MCSCVWWALSLVVAASLVIDLWTRRIPNWITLPCLVAGFVYQWSRSGDEGLASSLCGVLLGVTPAGAMWLLKGMGLGDVKLLAAIGAWLGPEQTWWVLFWTALAGGVIACGYALWHGSLGKALDGTGDLIAHFSRGKATRHLSINLDSAGAMSIPYAPAIAIGTWMSFLMVK